MCPFPNRPRYRHVCVYGPIVYECLDSMMRSQVHLLQQNALNGQSPRLTGIKPKVRLRKLRVQVWTDEQCVLGCVRDWGVCRDGENACKEKKLIQEKSNKRIHQIGKGFGQRILFCKEANLKPLIARTLVIGKRNPCHVFVVEILSWC